MAYLLPNENLCILLFLYTLLGSVLAHQHLTPHGMTYSSCTSFSSMILSALLYPTALEKKAFEGHLWYLPPEIIPLALFSSHIFQERSVKLLPHFWVSSPLNPYTPHLIIMEQNMESQPFPLLLQTLLQGIHGNFCPSSILTTHSSVQTWKAGSKV